MNQPIKYSSGYSLMELMVSVAIIGVLVGIAIPSYNGYIAMSCGSAASTNMTTLRAFMENYRLEMDTYVNATHAAGAATSTLMTALKWQPDDGGNFNYATTGATATGYTVTVTGAATGACSGVNLTETITD